MLEIGSNPDAAENVIRLTEPGLGVLFHTQCDGAI
jgi:hypothetical protein